jgi:hypothetical protein
MAMWGGTVLRNVIWEQQNVHAGKGMALTGYVCMCACVCVCMYVCMYVCMHVIGFQIQQSNIIM